MKPKRERSMFNPSKNPRVIRSLDKTSKALFSLLSRKRYSEITVTELCLKAGITRKTFYRDFSSLEDVVDYLVYSNINDAILKEDPGSLKDYLAQFYQFFYTKQNSMTLFYKQGLFYMISRAIRRFLPQSDYLSSLAIKAGFTHETIPYFWNALVGQNALLLFTWVERGFQEKPEELTRMSLLMSSYLLPETSL
jgi:AcrR family transcriptional regulator